MEYKLPNDILVEKSLLGAMLISEEALIRGLGSLVADDFYEKNVAFYEICCNSHKNGDLPKAHPHLFLRMLHGII